MIYDQYQDHLEWEILEPNKEITNLTFETGLYGLNKDCVIRFYRNNQYDLVATISGIIHGKDELEPNIDMSTFHNYGDIQFLSIGERKEKFEFSKNARDTLYKEIPTIKEELIQEIQNYYQII